MERENVRNDLLRSIVMKALISVNDLMVQQKDLQTCQQPYRLPKEIFKRSIFQKRSIFPHANAVVKISEDGMAAVLMIGDKVTRDSPHPTGPRISPTSSSC